MLAKKYLQLVLFNIYIFTLGLKVNLSAKDYIAWSGSNIIQTAESIKKITNDIFFALKLKKSKNNERIKQYTVTYNNFSSIISKEDENLHQVSIASRVDNTVGNVSRDLVDVINEVLDEEPGNHTDDSKHDDLHEDHFFKIVEYLKNSNGVNYVDYDIDKQILKLIRSNEHDNVTNEDPDVDDDDSSDNEFWRPGDNARRIYNGKSTKVRYFPFMASVHTFENFQCGGCIIKSDLVITAASCLQLAYNNRFFRENPAFLSVRIGSNYYVGGGESIPVNEVYFHPDYDPKSLNNNIAIMRLKRRIKFKKGQSRVKKIEIDRRAHRLPKAGIKKGVTVIGWGAKGVSNVVRDPWTNRLSVAVLGVYYLKDCQEVYSKKYVTERHFCVGFISKGAGACSGDVGGPGIIANKLAGIISFGSPRCGTPDAPTVFTKVGYYADWIDDIMEQEVPSRPVITTTQTPFTVQPKRKLTTLTMKPIFDTAVRQAEPDLFYPLREKTKKTHQNKDDMEIENDYLFNELLRASARFGSNEVNDFENLLDKEDETEGEQVKNVGTRKEISTTPADKSDSKTSVDHGREENSDDEEHEMIVESNEVPIVDDHEVVSADTTADGDYLDEEETMEDDGSMLKEIPKLMKTLDLTDEKDIDKLLAPISDESHSQETLKEAKKPRKRNKLKSSWNDKDTVNNVDKQYEFLANDEFFEINDLTGLF